MYFGASDPTLLQTKISIWKINELNSQPQTFQIVWCVYGVRTENECMAAACDLTINSQRAVACSKWFIIYYSISSSVAHMQHKQKIRSILLTLLDLQLLFCSFSEKEKKRSHFERNKLLIMHGEHQHGLFTYKILCSMFHQLMNIFRFRFLRCLSDEEFEMQKRQKLDVKSARCGIWCVISIFYVKPEWHTTCHIVKNCWHL